MARRVHGRGPLLKSLRGLMIRVHRYGTVRARTPEDRVWAGRLADRLDAALRESLLAAGAKASLEAAEHRAARQSKTHRPNAEDAPGSLLVRIDQ
jgi:hypothetical protein